MILRLALAGLFLALVAADEPAVEWKEFTSKDSGFAALMPGKVEEAEEKVKAPGGNLLVKTYQAAATKNYVFLVAVTHYPAGYIKPEAQEQVLKNARDGAVAKGKLLKETKTKFDDKYPGRDLLLELPEVGQLRMNLYLVGDRLYQVVVIGPKEQVEKPETAKFLGSFKLVK